MIYGYCSTVEMLSLIYILLTIYTVLKLLKLATGMRALLDTVMQALPQVITPFKKYSNSTFYVWFINTHSFSQTPDMRINNPYHIKHHFI